VDSVVGERLDKVAFSCALEPQAFDEGRERTAGIRIVCEHASPLDQLSYSIEDDCLEQGFLTGEMPVDRPWTDAGATGYLIERYVRALGAKSRAGGLEDAVSVPPSVGTQRAGLTAVGGRDPGAGRGGVRSIHQTNLLAP